MQIGQLSDGKKKSSMPIVSLVYRRKLYLGIAAPRRVQCVIPTNETKEPLGNVNVRVRRQGAI